MRKTNTSQISINCHQKLSIGRQRKRKKMMPRGPKGEKRPADVIGAAVKTSRTRSPPSPSLMTQQARERERQDLQHAPASFSLLTPSRISKTASRYSRDRDTPYRSTGQNGS